MRSKFEVVFALVVLTLAGMPAVAQSASEMLERGIYLEETAGSLDRAVEIYEEIVDDATAHRPLVAEALFRIGMCRIKNDDPAAASEAFERIIAEYPEQSRFVAMARDNMPDDPGNIEFLPAPWLDGEVQRLSLRLAGGAEIGTLVLTIDPAYVDGSDAWRFRVRRRIYSDADNQAFTEVLARRGDLVPLTSELKHTVVGHFLADYDADKVRITTVGPDTTREERLEGWVFDNDQGFSLFRRLPLDLGYRAKMNFISPVAGGAMAIDVEVVEKEIVKVGAGEFECYRLDFEGVPQTFWFSTDPNHYLVKLEASGIVGELEEVYTRNVEEDVVHVNDETGFTVAVPPGWLPARFDDHGTPKVVLLDPTADARSVLRMHPARGACNAQAAAYRKLEDSKQIFHEFKLREESWYEREIDGRPAVSLIGEFREGEQIFVQHWTYVESGEFCAEFDFKVHVDKLDALRADFDAIVASYDGPRAPEIPVVVSPSSETVKAVVSEFHAAASSADLDRYVEHLSPDLIFLGTDRTERFDLDELTSLAERSFSKGAGWVAEPAEQNVFVSDNGTMAWFDERLDSKSFGEMRASGVLRLENGHWRIVQYHVGFPVPNDLIFDLLEQIFDVDEAINEVPVKFSDVPRPDADDPAGQVKAALYDFHLAASQANAARYFDFLAPEVVCFGTDRAERFSLAKHRTFVEPYLSRGVGWTSVPFEQHVALSPDGQIAWFEERLGREKLGELRGTGVMRKDDGQWRIVHYNLVLPVPNELAEGLVEKIRSFYGPG